MPVIGATCGRSPVALDLRHSSSAARRSRRDRRWCRRASNVRARSPRRRSSRAGVVLEPLAHPAAVRVDRGRSARSPDRVRKLRSPPRRPRRAACAPPDRRGWLSPISSPPAPRETCLPSTFFTDGSFAPSCSRSLVRPKVSFRISRPFATGAVLASTCSIAGSLGRPTRAAARRRASSSPPPRAPAAAHSAISSAPNHAGSAAGWPASSSPRGTQTPCGAAELRERRRQLVPGPARVLLQRCRFSPPRAAAPPLPPSRHERRIGSAASRPRSPL